MAYLGKPVEQPVEALSIPLNGFMDSITGISDPERGLSLSIPLNGFFSIVF